MIQIHRIKCGNGNCYVLEENKNADYFSKLFQVPIAMNANDVDLIRNQMKEKLFAKTVLGKVILKASLASFKKVEMDFTPSVFLEEGKSLHNYGIGAEIISLPGHTKGSIGIDCKRAGILVGDALMNMFYPTTAMLYEDWEMVLQSADKITGFGTVPIYFGHGKSVPNRKWVSK